MFVCVSTECFPHLPLAQAMERLAELEFTAVELDVHEQGGHLQPAQVAADPEAAIATIFRSRSISPLKGVPSSDESTTSVTTPRALARRQQARKRS